MAASIIVLGPSKWSRGSTHVMPDSPLQTRRRLAEHADRSGAQAVVLEDQDQQAGEDHFDFFLRVIRERDVRSYVVYWPLGARLHGLEVELGHLLTRMSDRSLAPEDVYLLAERRALGTTQRGTLAWSEPGNRTRYHEDLVARGCPTRRWTTPTSLWAHMGGIAWEHDQRHGHRT